MKQSAFDFGEKWVRDQVTEKRIAEFGVKFAVEDVSLDDIDWSDSLTNGARAIDPLNEDLVSEYACAMRNGDIFPACVVRRRKGKKLVIDSGNHRLRSAKDVGMKSVTCYVIESTDAAVCDLLPRVLNRLHGKRQSREEAVVHAVFAVDTYGLEHGKADALFNLPKGTVSAELRAREVRKLLVNKGIETGTMPKTHLVKMAPIKNDNVLVATARLLKDCKLNGDAADTFIKEVRGARTEAQQIAVVADWEKKVRPVSPGAPVRMQRNVRSKFLAWLTTGEKYLEKAVALSHLQITDSSEQAKTKERIVRLSEKLGALLTRGNKASGKNHNGRHSP